MVKHNPNHTSRTSRNGYSEAQMKFLSDNRLELRANLTKMFNTEFGECRTVSAIQSLCKKYRFNSYRRGHSPRIYTADQMQFLSDNKTKSRQDLTDLFNAEFNETKSVSAIQGVCKRNNFLTGNNGRYSKGNIPFNKGTKGFMKANKGSFKKGLSPNNKMSIGSERVLSDGYTMIKTANPNTWRLKQRVIWEEEYGPIPKGQVLRFIDKNRANVTIENLVLLTLAENAVLNTYKNLINYKGEEMKTAILLAKIKLRMRDLNNGNK